MAQFFTIVKKMITAQCVVNSRSYCDPTQFG